MSRVALATRRFLLRDFTADDAPGFIAYQCDPRYRALYPPDATGPAQALLLLERFAQWQAEKPRRHFQLAVVRRGDGTALLGCAGLRRAAHADKVAELGIELAPDAWGRYAYALEIAAALLRFGFETLRLDAIRGVTTSGDRRVARLAQWFGAVAVGSDVAGPWPRTIWEVSRQRWDAPPCPR